MALHTEQLKRTAESLIDVASSVIDSQSVLGTSLSEINPAFTYSSEVMPGDSASNLGFGRKARKADDGIKEWLTGLEIDDSASEITLKGEATSEHKNTLHQGLNRSHDSAGKLPSLPKSPDAAKPGNNSAEQDSLDRALIALSRTKVMQNQTSMIAFLQDLVSNGVTLNAQDEEGLTAMHWASREGHLGFVKFLCERGADMNLKSNEGQSALHEAIVTGQISVVKLLLKHEATDVEQQDRFGRTPLLIAAQHGYPTILSALLKSNADLSAKTKKKNTALHLAAYYDEIDCVKLLLQNQTPLASRNQNGRGPLHMAASCGSNKCVFHLSNAGAPLEAKDSEGYTALSLAAVYGRSKAVELLLDAGAKTDYRDGREYWAPPLNQAAAYGRNECAKLLLDAGAPLEAVSSDGCTALMNASFNGQSEIIKLLLKAGAKVNAQNNQYDGCSSLMYAAFCGHRDIIDLLLAAGAKIAARDICGQTVLFSVMMKHPDDDHKPYCSFCSGQETRKDIMKFLCQKGADVSAVDDYGHSLLKFIRSLHHIDQDEKKAIEKIIRSYGAK